MRILHYSVPLEKEMMDELKEVVGISIGKDALTKAVEFTISHYKNHNKGGKH